MDLQTMGRVVALFGLALAIVGGLLWLAGQLGLSELPGNIRLNGQGWSCVFPIAASIVISLLLTIVLNVLLRFFWR